MRVIAGILTAAAVLVPSAGSAEVPGQLLAISASGMELSLVSASGDVAARIVERGQGLVVVDATWSPDGSRVAFTSAIPGRAGREVFVLDTDGGRLRAVTRDSDLGGFYNTRPVWISPREIVYHRIEANGPRDELWIVDVETGALRRLVAEADANYSMQMQPHGSLLVYGLHLDLGLGRAFVDVRTGKHRLLPGVHEAVAWSHDGDWLAYGVTGGQGGLHVMRSDGTDGRTLVSGHNVEAVSWSPDDGRLAFVVGQQFPELTNKFGTPARRDVYRVAADGSDLRRLTGIAGDGYARGESIWISPTPPEWWPDGSRLFVRAARELGTAGGNWAMNADGSCEVQWARPLVTWVSPQWRPGAAPALGPSDCASVVVRLRTEGNVIGVRGWLIRLTVRNDGTQPLRNLRVTLSTPREAWGMTRGMLDLPDRCHRLVCELRTLTSGEEVQLEVWATAKNAGRFEVDAAASYDGGPDAFPPDDKAWTLADWPRCDVLGTAAAERLRGTQIRERICGRSGDDWIDAKAGNDDIEAGPGRDTVHAGRGSDVVRGGAGADLIVVNDGERDDVDCGTEVDIVIADRNDVLHRCERVRPRRVHAPTAYGLTRT